jgi:transcriptional regulator with XRE-family HTH domain
VQVADAIGIKRNMLSYYENNKAEPDFDTLLKIVDFFDVTADDLLRIDLEAKGKVIGLGEGDQKGKAKGKGSGKLYEENNKLSHVADDGKIVLKDLHKQMDQLRRDIEKLKHSKGK